MSIYESIAEALATHGWSVTREFIAAELVREYGLPREALRSEHLTQAVVWEALLEDMPMTALVRNLATDTR